jgi:cyclin-dependent kinase 8/11
MHRDDPREFAIKKFKPDREGDTHHYVGISQSACREIAVILILLFNCILFNLL